MTITAAEIDALLGVLKGVDWGDAQIAVASRFANLSADEAVAESLFDIAAPVLAPYLIAAAGLSAIPGLGLLTPLLLPTIAIAAANFRGGDPDPTHDAQMQGSTEAHGHFFR